MSPIILKTMANSSNDSNEVRKLDRNRRGKTPEERIQEIQNELIALEESINENSNTVFCAELQSIYTKYYQVITNSPSLISEFSRLNTLHCSNR